MKTLKAKLFLHVGVILLIVAVLNIVLAKVWIQRGLNQKGSLISSYVEAIEKKLEQFASFLVTMRLVEKGTGLERDTWIASAQTAQSNSSLWEIAKKIALYDPEIAFVQISQDQTVVIAPQDAPLHPFCYDKNMRIKIVGKEGEYIAQKADKATEEVYLLFAEKEDIPSSEPFFSVTAPNIPYTLEDSPSQLFTALLSDEVQWIYKVDLIEALLSFQAKQGFFPLGAIKIAKEGGGCIWSHEVFSMVPYVQPSAAVNAADLALVKRSSDIDVVREVTLGANKNAYLGFSIASVLKNIAFLSNKTILVRAPGMQVAISPMGHMSDFTSTDYVKKQGLIEHGKELYVPLSIDFSLFQIDILTPESDAFAITYFLQQLGQEMITNVALSLIAASCISFAIALALLRNVSATITRPITMLSESATHLGDGHYENIYLPNIEHRQDEVATLTRSFAGMVKALQDRDKIRNVLHKVVSKEISEEILKRNVDFTGEERILTMLFSDIRDFTKMSGGYTPRALIAMLNGYLTRMCRIIDGTHGVVDKFVGDEIMTLYGAPLPLEGHATWAIRAALAMIEDLKLWNGQRQKEGQPIFAIGIGIHTGLVYAGNMGAENRLNYTAIGSNVNLASRVCSVAKGMQILITQETWEAPGVKEHFMVRPIEPVTLKGIEGLVQLYEVVGPVSVA